MVSRNIVKFDPFVNFFVLTRLNFEAQFHGMEKKKLRTELVFKSVSLLMVLNYVVTQV